MGNHQVRFLGEGVAVMPPPYPTRNQSGFSRRGAEASVPLQKKAPEESGAEKARAIAPTILLSGFLLLDCRLLRGLNFSGRFLRLAGALWLGGLSLRWSECSLSLCQ